MATLSSTLSISPFITETSTNNLSNKTLVSPSITGTLGINVSGTAGYKFAIANSITDKRVLMTSDANAGYVYSDGNIFVGTTGLSSLNLVTNNTARGSLDSNGVLTFYSSPTVGVGNPSVVLTGDNNTERISIRSNSSADPVVMTQTSGGTTTSPTVTTSGSTLGGFQVGGYTGSAWQRGGYIRGYASENWTSTSVPTDIAFLLCPSGSTSFIERMRIKSTGAITKPYQPYFKARQTSGGGQAPGAMIIFNTEDADVGGVYDPSNGRFTAPVAGVYQFEWNHLMPYANSGEYRFSLYQNGTGNVAGSVHIFQKAANTWQTASISKTCWLNAGDYINVWYSQGSGNTYTDGNYNSFTGYLLG